LPRRRLAFRAAAVWLSLALIEPVSALEISPGDDVRGAIGALQPGEELVLHGGTYTLDSGFRISVNGTATEPIVIRAAQGEKPVIRQASPNHNVIEIAASRYLEVRGITFTGGSHGVRLMDSDYVTISSCEIFETGDVALSANSGGTYTGLRIIGNHIHHTNGTGEGLYLGCNSDGCRVEGSLIAGNYIHHTNGPTVVQGDGIELKEGSSGNVIRDNVIHDTNYPGILVYSTVGNGPPNLIEGNVLWNSNDNGMQVAADAVVRNNIVLGAPVSFQPHQSGSPANIEFVHNTVVVPGSAIDVRGVTGPVLIANNAVYSQNGSAIRLISGNLSEVTLSGNVGHGGLSGGLGGYQNGGGIGSDFINGHYGAPPIDLYPAATSALIDRGDPQYQVERDFNGNPRSGEPDVGAYTFQSGANPGWEITGGFKGVSGEPGTVPQPPYVYKD
jgi:parallel beta-helix repeat protein